LVEHNGRGQDSLLVPTIAQLLTDYRDRTNASYDDMSATIGGGITGAWLQVLATKQAKSFPTKGKTVELLADLLEVSTATIVLAFAASIGLPVEQRGSHLSISLPPGTEDLEPADVEAVRSVIRQLVQARKAVAAVPDAAAGESLAQPVDINSRKRSQAADRPAARMTHGEEDPGEEDD